MNEKLNADKERLKADLSDTVQDVKEHVAAKAGQVKEQVVAKAGQVKESARQQAQQLKGQAKEQAGKVLDKTRELVDKASEKVKENGKERPASHRAGLFVCVSGQMDYLCTPTGRSSAAEEPRPILLITLIFTG